MNSIQIDLRKSCLVEYIEAYKHVRLSISVSMITGAHLCRSPATHNP